MEFSSSTKHKGNIRRRVIYDISMKERNVQMWGNGSSTGADWPTCIIDPSFFKATILCQKKLEEKNHAKEILHYICRNQRAHSPWPQNLHPCQTTVVVFSIWLLYGLKQKSNSSNRYSVLKFVDIQGKAQQGCVTFAFFDSFVNFPLYVVVYFTLYKPALNSPNSSNKDTTTET